MVLMARKILCVILLVLVGVPHGDCVSLLDSIFEWFDSADKEVEEQIVEKDSSYFKWIKLLTAALGYHDNSVKAPPSESYLQQCFTWVSWFLISAVQMISYLLNLLFIAVMYSIGLLCSTVVSAFYSLTEIGNALAILLVLSLILITGVWCWVIYSKRRNTGQGYSDVLRGLKVYNKRRTSSQSDTVHKHWQWIMKGALWLVIGASLLSIPWEFIRLYKTEQAKRAAVVYAGLPPDCDPHKLTLWQTFKAGLLWHFSWVEHNHCEKYYHAVLVDPLWEVTPMVVLSSFLARCVLHPVEMVSNSLGKSLKLFFSQIPSQWQPVFIVIILLAILVVLLMTCRYRIRMPLLFAIEPITPTNNRVQSRKTYQVTKQCIMDKPRQRNKKQSREGKT